MSAVDIFVLASVIISTLSVAVSVASIVITRQTTKIIQETEALASKNGLR